MFPWLFIYIHFVSWLHRNLILIKEKLLITINLRRKSYYFTFYKCIASNRSPSSINTRVGDKQLIMLTSWSTEAILHGSLTHHLKRTTNADDRGNLQFSHSQKINRAELRERKKSFLMKIEARIWLDSLVVEHNFLIHRYFY